MKKRILGLLLTASLVASLAGCSSGGKNPSSSDATNKGTPYTLTVAWPVYGDAPADLAKIQDKVNEISSAKLNLKVQFKPVSVTAMANTYSLAVSSGEKLDLISMSPTVSVQQYAQNKMIKPIDDFVNQYGKDIKAGLGDDTMKAGMVNGKQYVIPTRDPFTYGEGVFLLDSIVKKYNIDVTKIKTIDDLEPIFAKVHAAEPDMTMFYPFGVTAYLCNINGQPNGFANGGVDNLKVINVFGTDEYLNLAKKMRDWYQKGYISKDFATVQSSTTELMNSNKLFCGLGATSALNTSYGLPVPKDEITFINPVLKNASAAFSWAVPITAEKPEKSIQFLNLVFQNQDLNNLLKFGIEGVHYVKQSDGTIDASIGIKNYLMNWSLFGNPDKYLIKKSDLAGVGGSLDKYKSTLNEWKKTVQKSQALGFVFDPEPVKNEVSAVTAACDQYEKLIEGGAVDPDKYIKTMNDKMYAAGLQKIIDEEQRQVNEWVKTKK